ELAALIISDVEEGMYRLFVRELDDPKAGLAKPLAALDAYEVDGAVVNDERTRLAVVTNENGYGTLHVFALPGFEPVALPEHERGVVGIGDFRGETLVWSLSNA